MLFTENMLESYADHLSKTEEEKCKHTIEMIRDALRGLGYSDDQKYINLIESDTLSYSIRMTKQYSPIKMQKIHIFIQGSYANNTCVRNESDVDIAIEREDIYDSACIDSLYFAAIDKKQEAKRLKSEVESILQLCSPGQVHRKNKSIKVNGNTNRKNADTVPCLSLRYYYKSYLNDYSSFYEGILICADDGTVIVNFPKEHLKRGKDKNKRTHHYYKKLVRIFKKIRNLMINYNNSYAAYVTSFGLESLLWNVPDYYFLKSSSYGCIFNDILTYLYTNKHNFSEFLEANGIKKLFNNQEEIDKYYYFIYNLSLFFQYDYNS